jgi:hypothetical protein
VRTLLAPALALDLELGALGGPRAPLFSCPSAWLCQAPAAAAAAPCAMCRLHPPCQPPLLPALNPRPNP